MASEFAQQMGFAAVADAPVEWKPNPKYGEYKSGESKKYGITLFVIGALLITAVVLLWLYDKTAILASPTYLTYFGALGADIVILYVAALLGIFAGRTKYQSLVKSAMSFAIIGLAVSACCLTGASFYACLWYSQHFPAVVIAIASPANSTLTMPIIMLLAMSVVIPILLIVIISVIVKFGSLGCSVVWCGEDSGKESEAKAKQAAATGMCYPGYDMAMIPHQPAYDVIPGQSVYTEPVHVHEVDCTVPVSSQQASYEVYPQQSVYGPGNVQQQ